MAFRPDPTDPISRDHALDELRSLLLAEERDRVDDLKRQVESSLATPANIADVLPEAVRRRGRPDAELTEALMPTVEEAIGQSVRRDPQPLVTAIFPVMGPAIRKAITAALREAIQSLNQTLEHSFSVRGLAWRMEAARTGKSFAEVVLLHSLVYRVEQVFLIHGESGLLIQHVVAASVAAPDADLVSGMLTAIQDFVRDSFGVGDGESLDTVQVGELTVWVERGPHAVVAGVIRGNAPEELRERFREAVALVHAGFDAQLREFAGDSTPFEPARPILENCLEAALERPRQAPSPMLIAAATIALLALVAWGFFAWQSSRRWTQFESSLRATPGLVVTAADRGWFRDTLIGLKDPLAPDPNQLAAEASVDPAKIDARWEPYHSLAPEIAVLRAQQALRPPPTVTLRIQDGVLVAVGSAPREWISDARRLGPGLSPSGRFDGSALGTDEERALAAARARLEAVAVFFDSGSELPADDQVAALNEARAALLELIETAAAADRRVSIEVIGRADSEGGEQLNLDLSRARAEYVRRELGPEVNAVPVALGSGSPLPEERTKGEERYSRSVTLAVRDEK